MKRPDYRVWFAAVWLLIVGSATLWESDVLADDYVVVSGLSYHDEDRKYGAWNERNWGLGFERNYYESGYKSTLSFGQYKDSFGNTAYYAGAAREYRLWDSQWFAGGTFQITRRDDLYGGFPGPIAFLSASYDGPVGINIVWVPTAVVGIQFKVEL